MANTNATPLFLITNEGLAVASTATPQGPYIHIVGFQIGSGYGYQPDQNQAGLQGTVLYQGTATSYNNIGNNTIDILCEIPPEAGPFQFGEVGLFLADSNGNFSSNSVLFAIAVFQTPQNKFSSLGTNVVASYALHCLLKLQQSTAVFQINTANGPPAVLDIYQWSDVYPPDLSANPNIPIYNVHELNSFGNSTLLNQATPSVWSVASTSYTQIYPRPDGISGVFNVANASASWVEIPAAQFNAADVTENQGNRVLLVRTADGFFRSVHDIATSGPNYRLNLNVSNDGTYNNYPLPTVPTVGTGISLFSSNQTGKTIRYEQIIDAPPTVQAGNGTYLQAPGIIAAAGLLHAPSQNTGRLLTPADDLNNTSLPSGLYSTSGGTYGWPANSPFTGWDYSLYHYNAIGLITQFAVATGPQGYPWSGPPCFFRTWQSSAGVFTPWSQLPATDRRGPRYVQWNPIFQSSYFNAGANTIQFGWTVPANGWAIAFQALNNSGAQVAGSQIRTQINVNNVTTGGSGGDGDLINLSSYNIALVAVSFGDNVSVTGTVQLTQGNPTAVSQHTGLIFVPGF
jgi:hypothetical protein